MDKNTLSNYGWVVVCVLVLSVMLALATPFGRFIATGFESTYTGFAHVANGEDGNRILEAAGLTANGNGGSGAGSATCDHSAGNYSIYDNGDGKTHIVVCDDCYNTVEDRANETHTDANGDDMCDVCEGMIY